MPETTIFFERSEEFELVEHILDHGAWFVPDVDYEKPAHATLRGIQAYKEYRGQTRLFFILKETYLRSPLEMRAIKKKGRIVHFIMQRNGGPTLDFLGCTEYQERGHRHLSMGSISYYPTFWNTIENRNEKPPMPLVSFYQAVMDHIKSHAIRIKPGARTYWIGKRALQSVKGGARLDGVPQKARRVLVANATSSVPGT